MKLGMNAQLYRPSLLALMIADIEDDIDSTDDEDMQAEKIEFLEELKQVLEDINGQSDSVLTWAKRAIKSK